MGNVQLDTFFREMHYCYCQPDCSTQYSEVRTVKREEEEEEREKEVPVLNTLSRAL